MLDSDGSQPVKKKKRKEKKKGKKEREKKGGKKEKRLQAVAASKQARTGQTWRSGSGRPDKRRRSEGGICKKETREVEEEKVSSKRVAHEM